MKRANFPQQVRMQAFARDRAICGYTGVSLWLADAGVAPAAIDSTDHIKPASRQGSADLSNAITVSVLVNWVRRAGMPPMRLFCEGRPTSDFYTYYQ